MARQFCGSNLSLIGIYSSWHLVGPGATPIRINTTQAGTRTASHQTCFSLVAIPRVRKLIAPGNPVYIWAKQLNATADSPSSPAPAAPDSFTAVYGQTRTGYSQTTATYSQPGQALGTHSQQAQIYGQSGTPYTHLQTTYNQPEATYGQPERTYTHPEALYTQPGKPYAPPTPVPSRFDSVLQKTCASSWELSNLLLT
jgi:hypothetical protein